MRWNGMRVMRWAAVAVLCGGFLVPAIRGAAGESNSWELGLFGGYAFLDDYEGLKPKDDLLYGVRVGYWMSPTWSFEGALQTISTETDLPLPFADVDFDQSSLRWNGLYNFRPETRFRPFLTFGVGAERSDFDSLPRSTDLGANVGGGLRWLLSDRFGVRLDARYVYADVGGPVDIREGQGNVETAVGVLWALGGGAPADADGDGVPDRRDKCPDTPKGATVDARGCPADADGDGVFDGLDRCPDTPAGCPVDGSGCPLDGDGDGVIDCRDECADTVKDCKADARGCTPDEDGDGVCDTLDKCPATKSGCRVDATGCPADEDRDGVCDGADNCPGTQSGCSVDGSGCPADEDRDGVCDGVDECRGTPAGARVDERGCEVVVEKDTPLVLEGVNFDVDSDRLTPQSSSTLDRVAESLLRSPGVRVEVAGHTDSTASDAYNLALSQRRAEAVRRYLAGKGVDDARMSAQGYGESQPLADNATAEGRARNRRVELRRLD